MEARAAEVEAREKMEATTVAGVTAGGDSRGRRWHHELAVAAYPMTPQVLMVAFGLLRRLSMALASHREVTVA